MVTRDIGFWWTIIWPSRKHTAVTSAGATKETCLTISVYPRQAGLWSDISEIVLRAVARTNVLWFSQLENDRWDRSDTVRTCTPGILFNLHEELGQLHTGDMGSNTPEARDTPEAQRQPRKMMRQQ